jgi:putative transposase
MRTSNLLDRAFKEVRRRTKVVGRFPTESSALAVIFGILTIESTKWRGLTINVSEVKEIENAAKEIKANPIELDFVQEVV